MTDINEIVIVCLAILSVVLTVVNLPGLILLALLYIYLLYLDNFTQLLTIETLIVSTLILIGVFIDNILVLFGVKVAGGTKWGIFGAFIGMIFGAMLFPPFGLILGSMIGAVLFEYILNNEFRKSLKAGVAVAISFVIGYLLQLLFTVGLAIFIIMKLIFDF